MESGQDFDEECVREGLEEPSPEGVVAASPAELVQGLQAPAREGRAAVGVPAVSHAADQVGEYLEQLVGGVRLTEMEGAPVGGSPAVAYLGAGQGARHRTMMAPESDRPRSLDRLLAFDGVSEAEAPSCRRQPVLSHELGESRVAVDDPCRRPGLTDGPEFRARPEDGQSLEPDP